MEKSESQKKRNDSRNKDEDDGSRKAEQRPKDDFSGHETADEGSKLKSASEPMNEPKKEKMHENKKAATDAKQDEIQVKEEHKVKEQMITEKMEEEATEDQKEEQKSKEEHKRREKLTKQQKQEKVEKERENKDIKEEEKRKDEKEEEKEHEIEQEREDEMEEDRKEEENEEEKKEEERKELRDDANPTLKCQRDDDRKDIIEKHPILVKLLNTKSSLLKNTEHSGSVSACATSPKSGIPKPITLAAARRSVSPQPPKDVCRETSPPPRPTPDSPSLPEERNVSVLSPRKNAPEDPLPRARIPDTASRIAPTRNVVVKGALARERQSRNVLSGSRDPDNKVDPDFDRRDRPPPSFRPAPRNASKSPSPKKSKDQPKKPAKEQPPSPKK